MNAGGKPKTRHQSEIHPSQRTPLTNLVRCGTIAPRQKKRLPRRPRQSLSPTPRAQEMAGILYISAAFWANRGQPAILNMEVSWRVRRWFLPFSPLKRRNVVRFRRDSQCCMSSPTHYCQLDGDLWADLALPWPQDLPRCHRFGAKTWQ